MVEQSLQLNDIFGSLSDPTRRDILQRVARGGMSIGAIAEHYYISFAAIAKHLKVLENAGLVRKTRHGKEQIVTIEPQALMQANKYLEEFEKRLDSLDTYLSSLK